MRLPMLSFLFISCFYTLITLVFVFNIDLYFMLDSEFGLVENVGAFCLLVTSIVLFKSSLNYKKINQKSHALLFLFVAILFFWAAGEEISWGQHFFGFGTPEWMAEVNGQNETNLHNINKKLFDRILDRVTVSMVIITAILHFFKIKKIWGILLPPLYLNLAFGVLGAYRRHDTLDFEYWSVGVVILLVYFGVALLQKNGKIFLCTMWALILSVAIVTIHHVYSLKFGLNANIAHEIRESAFSVLCVFYACVLLKNVDALVSDVNR